MADADESWGKLPHWLIDAQADWDRGAILVGNCIVAHTDGRDGTASIRISHIAEHVRMSRSAVTRAIRRLERAEILHVIRARGRGNTSTYSFLRSLKGSVQTPCFNRREKVASGAQKVAFGRLKGSVQTLPPFRSSDISESPPTPPTRVEKASVSMTDTEDRKTATPPAPPRGGERETVSISDKEESNSEIAEYAPNLNQPKFVVAWADWQSYQVEEFGRTLGAARRKTALRRLSALTVTDAVTAIEYSIDRGSKTISSPNYSTNLAGETIQPGGPAKKDDLMAENRASDARIRAERAAAEKVIAMYDATAIEQAWQDVLAGEYNEYLRRAMAESGWRRWVVTLAHRLDQRAFTQLVIDPDSSPPERTSLFETGEG